MENSMAKSFALYSELVKSGLLKEVFSALFSSFSVAGKYLTQKGFKVSDLYKGSCDISFLSFSDEFLRERKLKISLAYIHGENVFVLWLLSQNREIGESFAPLFEKSGEIYNENAVWGKVVCQNPDFSAFAALAAELCTRCESFAEECRGILDRK